ncbi:MAG TPA: thioester reductase domain-containing protein [Thermoanaerobaculia bacterium]|nr:thioester reductase domain-containing protein [Thermoanaerobaculia bacterium]
MGKPATWEEESYSFPQDDICSALDRHAAARPDGLALRFLHDGEADGAATELTFAALRARALNVAAALQQRLQPGDRALLLYEGGVDFVTAFFGCLYAGIVAAPANPPDPRRMHRTLPRLRAIVEDARAGLVLTSADILDVAEPICAQAEGLRDLIWLGSSAIEHGAARPRPHAALPSDLAFLQYTSGSTGDPKGVMITRDNLAWGCNDLGARLAYDDACHQVSWYPVFHDGGLVWGLLTPIVAGIPVTFMLPTAFLQRPARWLEAITRFAGTHTAAPNFGFDLAAARIGSDVLRRLDLSSLRFIANAAEPVRASTIETFTRTFGPAGFRAEAMRTVYGLAEATLRVTVSRSGAPPVLLQVSARALEQDRIELTDTGADARILVGNGQAGPEPSVAIVDVGTSRRLGEEQVGEIWARGRGIGRGYWGRPEVTAEVFGQRIDGEGDLLWLRTGDLGFVSRGELFVVGRIKDMLIIRGRNLYPQDLELVAERTHAAVRASCVAAFSLDVEGEERAGLVAEVDPGRLGGDSLDELIRKLRLAIAEELDVAVHDLALIEPRSIFKTSSGKIQRRRTRAALAAEELPILARWTAPRPAARPATFSGADLERRIWEWLSESLGLPEAPLRDVPFRELGLDSAATVGLSGRIAEALGRPLSPRLLFDYPTLGALVAHLIGDPVPVQAARGGKEPPPPAAMAAALAAAPDAAARVELLAPHLERQLLGALGRARLDPDQPLSETGLDDVLAAELCLRMARDLGLRVFPRELLGCGTLHDFVRFAADITAPYRAAAERLTLAEIDRRVTSPYNVASLVGQEAPRADPMLFILSPPRSGSTLLRVMLAGHSRLFSPQELYLGCFSDMAAYDRHLGGTVLNMGVIATIAELLSRTGAWNLYVQWTEGAVPTAEAYSFFSARLGGRTLVDKSPLFFPPQAVIRRLASLFPRARFVHLVRHPVASISSYVRERFHGIFPETRGIDPYDCGEWVWTRVQEGILEVEAELGPGRMHRLYFEDLAGDPERALRRLCPSLGLSFEPALLTPYSGHRMVAGGFQVGDPNFTRHTSIRADKAEAWRDEALPHGLRDETLAVAERLGYDPLGVDPKLLANDRPRPAMGAACDRETPGLEPAMGGIDLERDAALPLSVVPQVSASRSSGAPRSIFLTGATGFLGAFVLDALLQRTEATIHCLVRASDDGRAWQRLRGNLERYGLWREDYEGRLRPAAGDVSAPRMGMPAARYASLGEEVDVVLHGAAQMSWLSPYRDLFASNVEGTRQLLQFAAESRGASVHYVSSLGTALIRPFENTRMVDEVTARSGLGTESILELPLGYLETKWVAHRMIEEARRRGLPVTLYAPGLITGHSQTGIDSLSPSQFLHALIKGSVQLGCFPDGLGWRFIPVDRVARDVVSCLLSPASMNQDIYLDSTSLLSPELMVETLSRFGFDVRVVPYAAWRRKVLALASTADTRNALFPFTDVIYALTPLRFLGQRYQLEWWLENRGCPDEIRAALEPREHIQPSVVSQMVGYYIRAGAMPAPANAPA